MSEYDDRPGFNSEGGALPDNQVLQIILADVKQALRKIDVLDDKVDRKLDSVHSRITTGEQERIRVEGRVDGLQSRVQWLYILLGGLIVSTVGGLLLWLVTTKGA